jgi:hypothetical protein
MVRVHISDISTNEAHQLFDYILERKYLLDAECSINPSAFLGSSVSIQAHDPRMLFDDLSDFFSQT